MALLALRVLAVISGQKVYLQLDFHCITFGPLLCKENCTHNYFVPKIRSSSGSTCNKKIHVVTHMLSL